MEIGSFAQGTQCLMDNFRKKRRYSFYTMIITKKDINVFAVNMYLKNPGANEFSHLVVSELLPKRLVSLDKVCIGPWHTLSNKKSRTYEHI